MLIQNISNRVSTELLLAKNNINKKIEQTRTSAPVQEVIQIATEFKSNAQNVIVNRDPGDALLLASKVGIAASLLSPASIITTHAKWSLATGFGTLLVQGRKLNAYYDQFVKYPDRLEKFWNEKANDASLVGRCMMYVPRHLSTFSVKVTALALETLITVASAVAKSTSKVVKETISTRIQDASKKDVALLAAQVLGIAIIALPTMYYFSQTISNGLRTVGSAVMAFQAVNFLKERSLEALHVDYNDYATKVEDKISETKDFLKSKKSQAETYLKSGSKKELLLKKAGLIASVGVGILLIPTGLFLSFRVLKGTASLVKLGFSFAKHAPHLYASYMFTRAAFAKSEPLTIEKLAQEKAFQLTVIPPVNSEEAIAV